MTEAIQLRVEDRIAFITINLPEKMNRLNFAAMRELVKALEQASEDPEAKVIVLTGAGDKAFCAGGDIGDFAQESVLASKKNLEAFAELCLVFNRVSKPSIAMINGYALAGGCGLAMLPTFGIASDRAKFGCPEIKVGLWPMMVMAILFRTIGRKKGLELICTGDLIDAHEAQRIGMINKVVPHEDLKAEVLRFADKLKEKSGSILSMGLEAFHTIADMEFSKAVAYLKDMVVILNKTPDSLEGQRAFLEKRKPTWES